MRKYELAWRCIFRSSGKEARVRKEPTEDFYIVAVNLVDEQKLAQI